LVIGVTSVTLNAKAAEYTVDVSHSRVGFGIRHIVSKVNGEFKEFEGSFQFDEKKPETGSVTFSVKANSINTNNEKRDSHLKSADFFDVEKYPTLNFVSKKVIKTTPKVGFIEGDLTIHGVTKTVKFAVKYLGRDKDPWGNYRAGFSAITTIKRKDFGLTWNKVLESGGVLVGEEVDIVIDIEGIEAAPKAEAKK
jgi:polyisoprenoid-binding protein YceI